MDILEVFWTNVDWHLKTKEVTLRKLTKKRERKEQAFNCGLSKILQDL